MACSVSKRNQQKQEKMAAEFLTPSPMEGIDGPLKQRFLQRVMGLNHI
jgi:hypothetical protein